MNDIVPVLLKSIKKSFNARIKGSARLALAQKALDDGTATHYQTQQVAQELGIISSAALLDNIGYGILPNDRMYYNIASRIIPPLFDISWEIIQQYGSQVQAKMNRAAGYGIKAVRVQQKTDIRDSIIEKTVSAEGIGAVRAQMDAPIKNAIWHMAFDVMRGNAEFIIQAVG
jgi:hypothetical protein